VQSWGAWNEGAVPVDETSPDATAAWLPAADVLEDESGWSISVELPGVRAGEISVVLTDDLITVTAERDLPRTGVRRFQSIEGRYGLLRREFVLPVRARPADVTLRLHLGTLEIRIPRDRLFATMTRTLTLDEEALAEVSLPLDSE
jgi:HSP20 family molecular chaperone IbpA